MVTISGCHSHRHRWGLPVPDFAASAPCEGVNMNRRTAIFLAMTLAPFATGANWVKAAGTEQPVAPEVNPPGDIPDNQVFITFKSPAGFSVKVPEGWARLDSPNETVFSDKYDQITLTVSD